MADYRLETIMQTVAGDKARRAAFRQHPVTALEGLPLSADQQEILANFDLQAMLDRGVNPLLIQGFWVSINGGGSLGEFVRRMNACRRERHG